MRGNDPVIKGRPKLMANTKKKTVRLAIVGDEMPCFVYADLSVDEVEQLILALDKSIETIRLSNRIRSGSFFGEKK